MAEISDNDLWECLGVVYRRWADAHDALKKVKAEKNDGSEDWQQFHNARLENTAKEEAKWRELKDRLAAVSPKRTLL